MRDGSVLDGAMARAEQFNRRVHFERRLRIAVALGRDRILGMMKLQAVELEMLDV
jgi:hypothetical protein